MSLLYRSLPFLRLFVNRVVERIRIPEKALITRKPPVEKVRKHHL